MFRRYGREFCSPFLRCPFPYAQRPARPLAGTVGKGLCPDGRIIFLDLNTSGEPFTSRVDTTDRHSDYRLPLSARIERHAEVTLPKVSGVTLPDDYEASLPYATFSCRFSRSGSTVSMTKTMNLKSSTVPLADIPAWNRAISDWNAACNRQIEVKL